MTKGVLRHLPSVTELIATGPLKPLVDRISHNVVVDGVRSFLDDYRQEIDGVDQPVDIASVTQIAERIARRILRGERSSLRPVINATGILLHTGLGRAPLAEQAIEAMVTIARDYASLELDLRTGKRSNRFDAVEGLLCEITGAEAAAVVNNNAGATMLTLAALGSGREVIVSRGQLIEIGGSYRLPDVMQVSGASLREVGTTNKTRAQDYENAICEQTAALMRVHPSNFMVVGFTAGVGLDELVRIGKKHQLPVIDDIGSGAITDLTPYGIRDEPLAAESIATGADVVLFSGDKLMGGPQSGIILGKRKEIERIVHHPMARALRVDKLTLAALEVTLRLLRDPQQAAHQIPLLQLLATPNENLRLRAESIASELQEITGIAKAEAIEEEAFLGGGSVPTQHIKTWCVAIDLDTESLNSFHTRLRTGTPAVVGRVQKGQLLIDLRSVPPRQDEQIVLAISQCPISAPN
jgi:L-seryl-tRNA(Ser) seleniumtransferase